MKYIGVFSAQVKQIFKYFFFSVYYYFILLRCCNYFLDQASELWYTFGVEDDEGISEDSFFH
jgi:hypothetical protein